MTSPIPEAFKKRCAAMGLRLYCEQLEALQVGSLPPNDLYTSFQELWQANGTGPGITRAALLMGAEVADVVDELADARIVLFQLAVMIDPAGPSLVEKRVRYKLARLERRLLAAEAKPEGDA